ncbi:MAG: OmpH family outer membrane protein [Chitinophagaceae bacterium]|nr:OmpH family outer membrane protein [Chitinophagaceae bacterium]
MKKVFTVLFIAMSFLMAANEVSAQTKIGYVSSQDLLGIMPETRKADSSLTQLRTALIQNAQEKETRLNADIEKFNKDSATMSEAIKTVKRQDLQKAYQDLAGEEQRIQEQLQQRQQELLQPIQKKANDAVQATAKENGYTYVFEKEVLIVAPSGEDILPLVAKRLGIKVPNQPAGTTPPPVTPRPNTKQ